LIFIAAIILVGILIYSFVIRPSHSVAPSVPIRSVIKVEPGHSLDGMRREHEFNWPSRTAMDISKDGSFIVYCAVNDDDGSDAKPQLFFRKLSQLNAEPIPGTEGGIAPFLSPDDRWVGFWTDGMLKKVPIQGGVPQDICEAYRLFGASWGDDNTIVFSGNQGTGLFCVSSQGGEPKILTESDSERGEYGHRLPSHLSNGKGVLFAIMRSRWDIEPSIAILEGKTKRWRLLLENASDACYIPTGHLVFLRQGTLSAIPFDLEKLDVYGQPVPIIPDVMQMLNSTNGWYNTASGQMSISDSGSLVYAPGGIIPNRKNLLVWVDQNGNEESISSHLEPYFAPRLSQDGRKILYWTLESEGQVWLYDIDRDISTPVISDGKSLCPNWTPDGKRIVFTWMSSSPPCNIYMISSDGSGVMESLITSHDDSWTGSFSPDGNLLAYVEVRGSQFDILLYDFRDKSITPFAATEHAEQYPEFSPDGRWIAYCTDQEGQFEVYIRPSSGPGETIKASRGGGLSPLWARSGKQLFYRKGLPRNQIWVVEIKTEPEISLAPPRLLFEKEGYSASTPIRGYDISLDDKRFLMVKREERPLKPVTEMILIQNWFEELKRLVPTRK
jgi:serine/threonine-protein kinase